MNSKEARHRYLVSEIKRHISKGRILGDIIWWTEQKESVVKPIYERLMKRKSKKETAK